MNWVQYMMPIMNNYKGYWKYTKIVLDRTGLWQVIKAVDKKNTIERKIQEFRLETHTQDHDFQKTLLDLYPELFQELPKEAFMREEISNRS